MVAVRRKKEEYNLSTEYLVLSTQTLHIEPFWFHLIKGASLIFTVFTDKRTGTKKRK
jgi:ribose/xylose/arabinose/galactoside ABC-type transport system permease subunit